MNGQQTADQEPERENTEPKAEAESEQIQPPPRPVKKRPKWYDQSQSILDRKF
jgi:hypothetical protein